jgi:hypothetical protein
VGGASPVRDFGDAVRVADVQPARLAGPGREPGKSTVHQKRIDYTLDLIEAGYSLADIKALDVRLFLLACERIDARHDAMKRGG